MDGMARVAAASLRVHLTDVAANERALLLRMRDLEARGVQAAVFPEMALTGYTLGDLVLQPVMQEAALAALLRLAAASGRMAAIIGLPLCVQGRLYNCAAVLQGGRVRGVVPKIHLPNGGEFYETRYFVSGRHAPETARVGGADVPFGANLLFDLGAFAFSVELCEDVWTPNPPSSHYAPQGAEIIFNPSASNALVAKHAYRRQLLSQQSARTLAGYCYAGAGYGESTSDLVFCGYTGVFENGTALAEGERFQREGGEAVADVDVARLRYLRQRTGSFFHSDTREAPPMRRIALDAVSAPEGRALRTIAPLPFVPQGADAEERLAEIASIQRVGLQTRMERAHSQNAVIGVSGGLDSTLALLIACRAFDALGFPRANLHAFSMPGFGTGARTRGNAERLMDALGVSAREVNITPAVRQHFIDIGQDEANHDIAYENSQARERTQILMDYANRVNGLVLGTGDMSEAALGFCTYNGDHMSMYNVNCSVPKTLVRRLVAHLSAGFGGEAAAICRDVIETPVSPELLPVTEGELNQKTEEILGDYALHDFFLYHMIGGGADPARLRAMALQAFAGTYNDTDVDKALAVFLRRFFTQQFKRNCVPDGPKVGTVALSPRGDWRMPSDMVNALWK